ncbi:EamA family transporter [Fodinicola acaciae]|uniref:EamA family transporter n=1 Tax=Fodinicola acaciae TaxID=2681555 RepID=UPI0013D4AC95|nr:DMT family transporter [Fodinicola acaciae]
MRPMAGAGLGLALLSAATFSTSGAFARSLTDAGWTAGAAVAARVGIAALILAIPAIVALRGHWRTLRRDAAMVAAYGFGAVAGAQVCFFNAIQYLPVGVALLLEYCGLILVVGWMWARHGQRPRRLTVAGSVLALVGLICVLNIGAAGGVHWIGVLWGLGSALGLATYFLLSANSRDDLPPVAMASGGMVVATVTLLAAGAIGLLPMHVTFGEVTFAGLRMSWLVPIIGVSVIAAVVSYVTGIGAARMLGPRLSSFVGLTEVLFAVFFAWLLLGELPAPIQLAGGVLLVAGVALVRLDELRPPVPRPETSREDDLYARH